MVKIFTPTIGIEDHKFRGIDPLSLKILRSLSYHKLPQYHLLKLSVLKLDGSSFDVNVSRNATIAELKQAVEDVFSSSPKDDGQRNISWSHVWGHFCLCYEGRKLLNDKLYIRSFGIKDGDQLKFWQNMSINYRPVKQRFKNIGGASRQCSTLSSGENAREEGEQTNANDNYFIDDQNHFKPFHFEEDQDVAVPKLKLAHFLKDRFSYSRVQTETIYYKKAFLRKV